MWRRLCHPNVLPLLGYTLEGTRLSLISEWMEKGSLRKVMTTLTVPGQFSMVPLFVTLKDDSSETFLSVLQAAGIAQGLCYLHSKGVIHADLKAVSSAQY